MHHSLLLRQSNFKHPNKMVQYYNLQPKGCEVESWAKVLGDKFTVLFRDHVNKKFVNGFATMTWAFVQQYHCPLKAMPLAHNHIIYIDYRISMSIIMMIPHWLKSTQKTYTKFIDLISQTYTDKSCRWPKRNQCCKTKGSNCKFIICLIPLKKKIMIKKKQW